jgi:hypothetical protein
LENAPRFPLSTRRRDTPGPQPKSAEESPRYAGLGAAFALLSWFSASAHDRVSNSTLLDSGEGFAPPSSDLITCVTCDRKLQPYTVLGGASIMADSTKLQWLFLIEQSLSVSIKGGGGAAVDLPSQQELEELKLALDRMRPLLWIYLNRKRGRPLMRNNSDPSLAEFLP